MEDADGALSFDFEGGLDAAAIPNVPPSSSADHAPPLAGAGPPAAVGAVPIVANEKSSQAGGRHFRQTVCRHWLAGLCMKGDACGYLHRLDRSRMPVCRFFAKYGECREHDCAYKHSNEDIKECNMYKMGFCPNGPDCRYRHQKIPGPFPPLEESLQKIQERLTASNGGLTGRFPSQRHGASAFAEEGRSLQQSSASRPPRPPAFQESDSAQQQRSQKLQQVQQQPQQQQHHNPQPQPQPQLQQQQQQQQTLAPENRVQSPFRLLAANGPPSLPKLVSASTPVPQGYSRFFIVKSSNRENLELSVERGLWATHRNNEAKLNDAFDSCDHVVLIFSVNETRHFQGCARMMSKIGVIVGGGGWKYAHGTAHYGRNFRLKWLKLCELSFNKTRHLRNPYNDNLPVKISRDCQELEPTIGEQLASLLYMEPDSELMNVANEAESKRDQEKSRAVSSGQEMEDANIIPFEENDDEQDDDESDEDDSSSQTVSANQGRGRSGMGRGSMWASPGTIGRGGRGLLGTRSMNFHLDMGGGDGFKMGFERFGMGSGDAYGMSGAGPGRAFPLYGHPGPRFSGPDFSNLGPGVAMGFGPIEGPVVSAPGMYPTSRQPTPNGIFAHGGPGIMGPPTAPMMGVAQANMMGASRPHFMGGTSAAGRSSRTAGMPFRPPQGGARGRRGFTDQQRRRRNERNSGNERLSSVEFRNMGKHRQRFPPVGETPVLESGVEMHGPAQPQQQQDGLFGNNTHAGGNEEDSDSEDEAPRRSRHGEGKKKKRDWEAEGPGETAWDQQQVDRGGHWAGADPNVVY